MKGQQFKNWLDKKYPRKTANSRWMNCRTVEKYEGGLEEHFNLDQCEYLISKLNYSTQDERDSKPKRHKIPINGDIRNGSATLKGAVKLYVAFRNGEQPIKVSESVDKTTSVNPKIKKPKTTWPEWQKPTNDDLYELVKLTARFAKFLHPDIIAAMMEDNNKNWAVWRANLKLHNIDPDIYLWHKSPCTFPGVRRYAGSKEIAFFRKHTELASIDIPNALQLDDNDFPKHLWSFVFRGKPFPKYGPKGYALAHLADHKNHKNRMYEEFTVLDSENETPIHGLYTAPTNTAFLPTSLMRPSDFSPLVRKILIEKANDLYGSFCKILPPNIEIKEDKSSKWHFSNFEWGEPAGNTKNMKLFFDYRYKKMTKYFK
jgi:hypothetical protein